MDLETFVGMLCRETDMLEYEVIPDELWMRILAEESTVKVCGGRMPMEDRGLREMSKRKVRLFLFGGMLHMQEFSTMSMVDNEGNEVGRHLMPSEIQEYRCRNDVVFMSDDFVLFPDRKTVGEPRVVLNAVPYRGLGDWVPEDSHAVLWFPSTSTDMILHRWFDRTRGKAGSVILGFDID